MGRNWMCWVGMVPACSKSFVFPELRVAERTQSIEKGGWMGPAIKALGVGMGKAYLAPGSLPTQDNGRITGWYTLQVLDGA